MNESRITVCRSCSFNSSFLPLARTERERHHEAGMGVQTVGEAYQAGWRIHVPVRLGSAGGL
jgi:hypothetical protein